MRMEAPHNKLLPFALALAALGISLAAIQQARGGSFVSVSPMNRERNFHTATLLPNGKVLVAGGSANSNVLSSAELYDPATEMWTLTGALHTGRSSHTATSLANGNVLVAGGADNSAELYDPATETWTVTGSLRTGRTGHTATLLTDGRVLVAGGTCISNGAVCGFLTSAELYDPISGNWTATGPLNDARGFRHTATLLPDGNLLVAGGVSSGNGGTLSSAELYDPITRTWNGTGWMSYRREGHTATLLPNGKVLVAGGWDRSNGFFLNATAELYDPLSGTWTETAPLNAGRWAHGAALLLDGTVLVEGGKGPVSTPFPLSSAEVYDPVSENWTEILPMSAERSFHTATLLHNGKVLVAAGSDKDRALSSADLYEPDGPGPAPSLTTLRNADGTLSLSWTSTGALEETDSLSTPNWQPAPSQDNPQIISTTDQMKFYRVKAGPGSTGP